MPAVRRSQRDGESRSVEAERYRVAAENALQQLDWAIRYLHRIRKRELAKALARNRNHIRRSLMRAP